MPNFVGPMRLERDPRGDAACCALVAKTSAPGATDVLTSATGFKGWEALLAGTVVAGDGTNDAHTEMVAVAASTVFADHAGVAAQLALAVTEFDSSPSTPPVLIPGVRILRVSQDVVGAFWDGETTIKTIGVRAVGHTPAQVDVLINVVS